MEEMPACSVPGCKKAATTVISGKLLCSVHGAARLNAALKVR
jgi:hypothetical protein